jgi:putative nucleotidyltransferase with HDIG domain
MDILKVVNSGAYLLNKKIEDINSALKYLGLRELYNLMFTLSIKKTLSLYDKKMNEFWYHSYKSAYYASHILRELQIKIPHSESIYTAALLHDIGKFPISMIFDDDNDILLDYCLRYNIDLSDIEDALSGIRHGETGYMMAEKWELPETLKLVMRYHHDPETAPEPVRKINDIVYLADCLIYSERGRFNLETTKGSVLSRYKIKDHTELKSRFEHLSASFENDNLLK